MKDVLKRSNGANFHLADLHVHTPADSQYSVAGGIDVSTRGGREEFAEQFVERALAKELSVVGITDHNTVDWIDDIRDAASATDLTVFPGFEVSTKPGAIHVVCLFEPETPKSKLDDHITQLGLPRGERLHRNGSNKQCDVTLEKLIEFVWQNDGIPIAAHVTRDHGILDHLKGESRIEAWTNEQILACELPQARSEFTGGSFEAEVIRNERDLYQRERPIACIYSSDSRSIGELGSRATYVKLSSLSVEGLKQAFLDWESRIRHPSELPDSPFSRLIGANWSGGFLDGLKIHFNRNMNCLIGGKGTGKSTIIETIRYAMDSPPEAEETARQHEEIVSEVFRAGSEIALLVEYHEPQPARYLIKRAFNSEPVVHRWNSDDQEAGEALRELEPSDVLPGLEIYGQKQILELSRDTSVQVALLRRFVHKNERDAFERAEENIQRRLSNNAQDIGEHQDALEDFEELRQQLAQLKERKRQYDETGLKEQLEEQREFVQEETLLDRSQQSLRSVEEQLEAFRKKAKADVTFLSDDSIDDLPNQDLLKNVREALSELNSSLDTLTTELDGDIAEASGKLGTIRKKWSEKKEKADTRYEEILDDLDAESVNPDEYLEIERRISELEPKVGKQSEIEEKVHALFSKRKDLLDQLDDNRRSYYRKLESAAKQVNRQLDGTLKVELEYAGRREDFLTELSELRSGARSNQLSQIVEHEDFSARRFADALREGADEIESRYNVTKSTGENLNSKCDREKIFELETFRIPTAIRISFNIGTEDAPNFKPTSQLSVGQRCTAILLLILLHEPFPLLIDQPEDDLDNTFVYSNVVERLREEKERRQFVIATHNANIPVLGDAELIQVLNAERGQLLPEQCEHGSIDDEELRVPVERILEGGREAFMLRKAKYGF